MSIPATRLKHTWRLLVQIGTIAALPLLILACSTHWLRENLTVVENENVADAAEWGEIAHVYDFVDEMPRLIGGVSRFLGNMRLPDGCMSAKVGGRILVHFIVDKDGNVRKPKVVESLGSGCDEGVIRFISEHAKYTPGRQDGKPVAVRMSIPIAFRRHI